MRGYLIAALICGMSQPAIAGGWTGGTGKVAPDRIALCADLAGRQIPRGTRCIDANGLLVVVAGAPVRHGIIGTDHAATCPYPHRPSDSVFINGAGYLLKDTLRRRLGCL